jgi:hypothetical protein
MPADSSTTSERLIEINHGTKNEDKNVRTTHDCAQLINKEIGQDTHAPHAFSVKRDGTQRRGSSTTRTEIADAQATSGEARPRIES